MIYKVEMLAFQPGVIRDVNIPDDDPSMSGENVPVEDILEAVFLYGQNDIQNVPDIYSVSCGDVIHISGERFQVVASGFMHLAYNDEPLSMLEAHLLHSKSV